MKYRCLVLDHDDTVVNSEEAVNYPSMVEALKVLRPGYQLSLEDFTLWTFREGFSEMCENHFGFTEADVAVQFRMWEDYVKVHMPPAFPGIRDIVLKQKEEGGIVCVSSHSAVPNITRDYMSQFGIAPDEIFGWELGPGKRKPAPYALDAIMEKYSLSPSDILMVDDMNTGWQMAKTRGVDFAWAAWSRLSFPEIETFMASRCDFAFRDTKSFYDFLFR